MAGSSAAGCVKCGACTVVCPVFRVTGRESLTARGRMHLLASELSVSPSAHFADLFTACLLCGRCEQACSRNLPITDLLVEARQRFNLYAGGHWLQKALVRRSLSHPELLARLVRAGIRARKIRRLPLGSGLRLRLGLLEETEPGRKSREPRQPLPEYEQEKGEILGYFTGCFAAHLQPSIAGAVTHLVRKAGGSEAIIPRRQTCCGLAAWSAGNLEEARRVARANIAAFSFSEGPILTSCASCFAHLCRYGGLFADDPDMQARAERFSARVVEFSRYFSDSSTCSPAMPGPPIRVWYHEPCHLRPYPESTETIQHLLEKTGRMRLVSPPVGTGSCCGQGGLFHLGYPEISRKIFHRIQADLCSCKPEVVTTTCSGCLIQFQLELSAIQAEIRVVHPATLLAEHKTLCHGEEGSLLC